MQLDKIACAHSHHFKTQSWGKGSLNDLNGFYGVQPLFKRTLLTKARTLVLKLGLVQDKLLQQN